MIKDYYQILALRRDATAHDVNSQYKRLVLRWHPRFAKEDQKTAHHNFSQISEAYEVLSDPIKRAFYDRYGYLKLKEGLFEEGQLKGGYRFADNPDEIFEQFFLKNNCLAQSVDTQLVERGTLFGCAFGGLKYRYEEKIPDLIVNVPCTLNELYNGIAKTVIYDRTVLNPDGRTTSIRKEQKLLQLKAGSNSATNLFFKGEGHESVSRKCSNLIFKIVEVPHFEYTRKGNDLFKTAFISLSDALDSKNTEITTLDNRLLRIPMDEIITPQTIREVEGEGMPCGDGTKGNLYIRFDIVFPQSLEEDKRNELRKLLC